ncbi:MAG: preprotein translocase subunit YajC [Dehalococcoidales bacterium]|jgi:preprotein translocase subunit YajC|nr:preprotein translocase subunit YajC [Dehalococcoidales bacterium]MDP6127687.1 preprotein translocase subunit YajC [Dehalococcoidales bacterium]MDP6501102.1 preprotein translocase subunit YajC [Dehalococcoidales bacterium]MDP7525089.1 preprotein translocase subunit YajC [Dehalococcoidales bacterium]|tara:strand:+ start:773 stop:1051 length:279 start_codon:yes stop_codon:yes gene_type:complete
MGAGFLPLVGVMAVVTLMIYFIMVRPVRQRERQHDQMVDLLEKGDKVITASGMYGQVEGIYEDSIVIKVESGAMVRMTKGGIVKRQDEPRRY